MIQEALTGMLQSAFRRAIAVGVLFLGLGISLGLYSGTQTTSANGKKFRPFVVRQQTTYFASDARIAPVARDRSFAARTDGSMVATFSSASPDGEVGTTIQIWDRRKGLEIVLEPFTRSKLTLEMTEDLWRQAWDTNHPGCPPENSEVGRNTRDAGDVLGIPVRRMETRRKEMRSEASVAPAFDCFPLRQIVWFPGGSRNETVTLSVSAGEPDESLFSIPEGYIERSPAELESVYAAKYPGHRFWGKATLDTAETRYRKHNRR